MAVENFKASAQYGDFTGTASADRADQRDANAWLKQNGLMNNGEFLLGVELFVGESHGVHKDPVFVHFLLVTSGGYENVKAMIDGTDGPLDVRRVSVDMPLSEFFGLFKRFSVCLSPYGMLNGREFRYSE